MRRVGKGTTISIFEDPWLPDCDPHVHMNHEAVQHNIADVLMNLERSSWDIDLVKDILTKEMHS